MATAVYNGAKIKHGSKGHGVVLKVLHTGRMILYELSCTFMSGKPRATGLKLAFSLFLSAH